MKDEPADSSGSDQEKNKEKQQAPGKANQVKRSTQQKPVEATRKIRKTQ